MPDERTVDALIIGGGPAGLSAARELRKHQIGSVLVCEREPEAGGVPRYTQHVGFGYSDFRILTTGPRYAKRLVRCALKSGVEILTETTVLEWTGDRTVLTTSPGGLCQISAKAILLATGCRETPRSAHLVPGTRPAGVFTTSSLQHLEHECGTKVGALAIVSGAEHVSFSAIHTLRRLGCKALALVTPHPKHQTYFPLKLATADLHRVPIMPDARVTKILGKKRVEGIEVTSVSTGETRTYEADTMVFTGGFIPEYEQAYVAGVPIDTGTYGPAADQFLRAGCEGVFAAGNVLRGAETSGVAAWEGAYAAKSMAKFLHEGSWPARFVPIRCESPLAYVSPNRMAADPTQMPTNLMTWRVDRFVSGGVLSIKQGSQCLHESNVRGLIPNRRLRMCPTDWLNHVDTEGPEVVARIL